MPGKLSFARVMSGILGPKHELCKWPEVVPVHSGSARNLSHLVCYLIAEVNMMQSTVGLNSDVKEVMSNK